MEIHKKAQTARLKWLKELNPIIQRDNQLLPQIQEERYARGVVATKQPTTEMDKMGKGNVQRSEYTILEKKVQGKPLFVLTLGIGMSVKIEIFEET
jgi:hypothetical protein